MRDAFNTSRVRLEVQRTVQRQFGRVDFQYLKGAIRREVRVLGRVVGQVFQYLKGAIRSSNATTAALALLLFQYLKGAIRSLCALHDRFVVGELSIPQGCD